MSLLRDVIADERQAAWVSGEDRREGEGCCDRCGEVYPLSELTFDGNDDLICRTCAEGRKDGDEATAEG